MTGRLVRWLRVTLPSLTWLGVAVFCLVTIEITRWSISPWIDDSAVRLAVTMMRIGFAVATAAAYGAWRVYGFHPLRLDEYRTWLMSTPWTWKKALPLGPVLPVAQDAVVIGLLAVYAGGPWENVVHVVAAAIVGYLIVLGECLYTLRELRSTYVLGFGAGFVVLLYRPQPLVAGLLLLLLLVVGCRATVSSLRRFPWDGFHKTSTSTDFNPMLIAQLPKTFGWPFLHLSPQQPCELNRGIAALNGLMVGWWLWTVAMQVPEEGVTVLLLAVFCGGLRALALSLAFVFHYRPPISLLGRLFTGRWIIPGYDRVFVMPLLAAAVVVGAWFSITLFRQSQHVMPIAVGLLVAIPGVVGPSPREWQLCGHHRLVPGFRQAGEYEEI